MSRTSSRIAIKCEAAEEIVATASRRRSGGNARADNNRTPVYSFRLVASLQLGRDWRSTLAHLSAPTEIMIGTHDELFNADQFKPMLQSINPRIGVTIVSNVGHLGMIANAPATAAIAATWRKLAGA